METPGRTLEQPAVFRWPSMHRCVPEARHALRATLSRWGLLGLADDACVVLSELMTNSIEHTVPRGHRVETRFVRLRPAEGGRPTGLRIEVHDAEESVPVLRIPAPDAEHGRGLPVVDALTAGHWGIAPREGIGKLTWAEL
ncbi:ATP-binding protein [Streptomyces sp. NPDC021020]|uniref:ATP-binding protein n=1 Tax=Streptomyces sp. NPDC021020 TaxID=3365109 RepID=UPI0037B2188E